MTTPENLEELARETFDKIWPADAIQTLAKHVGKFPDYFGEADVAIILAALKRAAEMGAAQSASVSEDVAEICTNLRTDASDRYKEDNPNEVYDEYETERHSAADTIEAQARSIAELTRERDGLLEGFTVDDRVGALHRNLATMRGALNKSMSDLADTRAQVTALTAENAVLREELERINIAKTISYEIHEGADVELHRCLLCAGVWSYSNMPLVHRFNCALSIPNDKAMRMVEVVKAAEAWKAEYEKPDDQPADAISMRINLWAAIIAYRAALTEGENGDGIR